METSWDRFGGRTVRLDIHADDGAVDLDVARKVYITNDPPQQAPTTKPDTGRAFDLGDKTE